MALAPACLILLMVGAEKLEEGGGAAAAAAAMGAAAAAAVECGRWLKVAWGPWEKELEELEEEKALAAAMGSQCLGLLLLLEVGA